MCQLPHGGMGTRWALLEPRGRDVLSAVTKAPQGISFEAFCRLMSGFLLFLPPSPGEGGAVPLDKEMMQHRNLPCHVTSASSQTEELEGEQVSILCLHLHRPHPKATEVLQ